MAETESISDCFTWEKGRLIPTFPVDILEQIINTPFPSSFDLYCAMMDIVLKPWQRDECLKMIKYPKYLIDWGRGMSKTYLFVLVAVFVGIFGMRVIYLVPRVDELEQPMQYFNSNAFVDNNPHKKTDKTWSIGKGGKSMWYYIGGKPVIKISNIDDKGFNVSSGRFDFTMYDECALLMYYSKEVELFNKANGMLMVSDYPHRIWASTPLIGSHFLTMKEDIEEHEPELHSWRNFQNTPDNFTTDTQVKMDNMLAMKADATRQGILYAWETEYLALPRTALGRAFMNVIEHPIREFPAYEKTHIGFDFHGWKNGHIWVAFYYEPRRSQTDVYILAEGAEIYHEADTADQSMDFLRTNPYFRGCLLKGESGGMINDPYIKAGRQWGMDSVSINGQAKHDLEANILNFVVHVDPIVTPLFHEDITSAEWKDPNKFILHKEASGFKFRNHYLDAFMNVLPALSLAETYIPNRRLRRAQGIVAEEVKRDREGMSVFF